MKTSSWRLATYLVIIALGILTALPNILPQPMRDGLPAWLPHPGISLGLDLRGGSHLVLEVDAANLADERIRTVADDARRSLADVGIKAAVRVSDGRVTVVPEDPVRIRDAAKNLSGLVPAASGGSLPGVAEFDLSMADGSIAIALTEAGIRERIGAAVEQSLEVIRSRIDQVGVAEPTIQRVGPDRILVQLPGVQDPGRIRDLIGSTAKMSFHLVADQAGSDAAYDAEVLQDHEGNRYPVLVREELSGDHLTDARVAFDPQTRDPVVSFRLDGAGAARFGDITRANVGRPFAIVLDGKVLSAPVINEPITGGAGQISGRFTVDAATDLAAMLRAGALPAKLTVIEERTVGADLGGDAIRMGLATGLAGFALVAAFMVVLYGAWGMLANVALGLNVILTFAGLSLLGATLTLPGIAGIVLGIGLAVDANVLINERIREETRRGRSAMAALDVGFRRAYSTILDSNLTALIATLLLFWFGSGPVRGFAVTMGLGIAISMFTAVSVVRVVMLAIVRRLRLKTLTIGSLLPRRLLVGRPSLRFMRARFFGIALSALLSAGSLVLFVTPGLNYGVDFRGGIQLEIATNGPADLSAFRSKLGSLGLGDVALQSIGDGTHLLVRVERQPGGEAVQIAAVEDLRRAVKDVDPSASVERTEVVGPKVSGELATAGVVAVVLASLAMLAYIWARFEWPFAVGAIATLVLDVTKTVGFFALTGLDFNLTAIAALLTLVGYSVNDKVVVYDRMRENMRLYKAMPLRDIIDLSINETLGRSLYTSATAFLALLPMALFGGSAVESFAVPMLFGIVIAASSSVFIAAPILLFLGDWRRRRANRRQSAELPSDPLPV